MCGDAEPMTFSRRSYPLARKQHKCCECGSNIDPGEKYERVDGVFEYAWVTFKTCDTCRKIRNEAEAELDYTIAFECLYEITGSEFEYAAG